jgi:hypothetical protein
LEQRLQSSVEALRESLDQLHQRREDERARKKLRKLKHIDPQARISQEGGYVLCTAAVAGRRDNLQARRLGLARVKQVKSDCIDEIEHLVAGDVHAQRLQFYRHSSLHETSQRGIKHPRACPTQAVRCVVEAALCAQ